MKIAAATEDGKSLSLHFGQAPHYLVLTVEEGKVVGRETRAKAFHHHDGDEQGHQQGHGHGPHAEMASAIADCQVMLVGGMGRPAYLGLKARGIEPIVTTVRDIDEAVQAYLDGNLRNLLERLH